MDPAISTLFFKKKNCIIYGPTDMIRVRRLGR